MSADLKLLAFIGALIAALFGAFYCYAPLTFGRDFHEVARWHLGDAVDSAKRAGASLSRIDR